MPRLMDSARLSFKGGGTVLRHSLETVLKVVVMGATMCSGLKVPSYDMPVWNKGRQGKRGTRQYQGGRDL